MLLASQRGLYTSLMSRYAVCLVIISDAVDAVTLFFMEVNMGPQNFAPLDWVNLAVWLNWH